MKVIARDVRVSFGGIAALSGVDLDLSPGEIVGLVGPNGAGKTTLFNCVTGVVSPDSGYVEVNGVDVSRMRFDRRVHSGLSRTFQTPRVNVHGSVLEAVMLGFNPHVNQPLLGSFFGSRGVRRTEADLKRRATGLIEQLNISEDPEKRAGDLSLGALRLLEVARALASDPRYVLLDEPAAGIDQNEQTTLAAAIRVAAAQGVGILIVEHNVPFVAGLCGKLVALVQGKIVASGEPTSVLSDREFVKAYLGTDDGQ
jgi:ABC-type branched-subunit amino acid transport system ATPase component